MSWRLPITTQPSGAPLTPAQLAAGMDQPPAVPTAPDPRPLLAVASSTCPAGLWPVTP